MFENQDAAVIEGDFLGIRIEGISGTVVTVEIGFVVGDPSLDRLQWRFDRFHGSDVEGCRWWAWRKRWRKSSAMS
jgi:hypothetical protein